jgi:ATPase subunit of ABC transporter with duplicated ATPase domains
VVVDKDVGSLGAASDPDNYNNKKPGDVTCTSDTIAKAAHTTPGRASMILVGIGFDHAMQARPTKRSAAAGGGESLSPACWSVPPTLLLLDKPTNHLNFRATCTLSGEIPMLTVEQHASSSIPSPGLPQHRGQRHRTSARPGPSTSR